MDQVKSWAFCVVAAALMMQLMQLVAGGIRLEKPLKLLLGAAFLLCLVTPFTRLDLDALIKLPRPDDAPAQTESAQTHALLHQTRTLLQQNLANSLANQGLSAKVEATLYEAKDGGIAIASVTLYAPKQARAQESVYDQTIFDATGIRPTFVWQEEAP